MVLSTLLRWGIPAPSSHPLAHHSNPSLSLSLSCPLSLSQLWPPLVKKTKTRRESAGMYPKREDARGNAKERWKEGVDQSWGPAELNETNARNDLLLYRRLLFLIILLYLSIFFFFPFFTFRLSWRHQRFRFYSVRRNERRKGEDWRSLLRDRNLFDAIGLEINCDLIKEFGQYLEGKKKRTGAPATEWLHGLTIVKKKPWVYLDNFVWLQSMHRFAWQSIMAGMAHRPNTFTRR